MIADDEGTAAEKAAEKLAANEQVKQQAVEAAGRLIATDRQNLEHLKVAQILRDFHHKALWEEEKHFTWLCSILLTAIALFITSANAKLSPDDRRLIVLILSSVGVVFSLIAWRVVFLESFAYREAGEPFMRLRSANDALRTATDQSRAAPVAASAAARLAGQGSVPQERHKRAFGSIRRLFMTVFAVFAAIFAFLAYVFGPYEFK